MNTKDYFAELFELSNNCKRLMKERKDTLLEAEEKIMEAWRNAGDLKPVEIKLENGKTYVVGTNISSNEFGTPEFKTKGVGLKTSYYDEYEERDRTYVDNGFWSYGNYPGKQDKEVLEYYKDFSFIKNKFEQFLKDRIEKIESLKSINE